MKFISSLQPSISISSGLFKRLKNEINKTDSDDSPCMMISARSKVNEPCYVEVLIEKFEMGNG